MTIQKEEPGLWTVVCDDCGERRILDTDPDEPVEEAVSEVESFGWLCHPVESVKFAHGSDMNKTLKVDYETHSCADCQ